LLNNEVRIFLREFSILEIRNFSEKKYCILSEQAFEEIFTEAQRIVVKILLQEKDFKKFFDNLKIEAHLNYNNIGGGGCNHC